MLKDFCFFHVRLFNLFTKSEHVKISNKNVFSNSISIYFLGIFSNHCGVARGNYPRENHLSLLMSLQKAGAAIKAAPAAVVLTVACVLG
jgi:hypothetical protein